LLQFNPVLLQAKHKAVLFIPIYEPAGHVAQVVELAQVAHDDKHEAQ